ncbi:MAG: hypothetical protein MJY68_06510 [Bacteroidaceae bacterium]|nr:hypothetical protein [Bacteroidaceae bacterium]
MTRSESWNAFIDELRTYVREHHHFPNKHTRLLSKVKYTRKKINDGTLEDWKKEQFLEVAEMRDMEEHCGQLPFHILRLGAPLSFETRSNILQNISLLSR